MAYLAYIVTLLVVSLVGTAMYVLVERLLDAKQSVYHNRATVRTLRADLDRAQAEIDELRRKLRHLSAF